MADDFDPFKEGGPFWAGKNADGTFTIVFQVRVRVEDLVTLRAEHLVDGFVHPEDGDVAPDWGEEHAVSAAAIGPLRGAPWREHGLSAIEATIRVGSASVTIPPGQL